MTTAIAGTTYAAPIADLRPHPRNYQTHPEDQLAQLMKSIEQLGFYRNVVVARDNTILAGHGVVQAATKLGKQTVPVIKLDLDPNEPRALKVLVSDNEISNLAMTDDRALTELLKEILDTDALLGTGYDEQQLAALVFQTRTEAEIPTMDAAAEWAGATGVSATEFDPGAKAALQLIVNCETREAFDALCAKLGVKSQHVMRGSIAPESKMASVWWPLRARKKKGSGE